MKRREFLSMSAVLAAAGLFAGCAASTKIEPYSVVELENAVYDPYVMRGNYPTLVERVTCKGIRTVSGKSA